MTRERGELCQVAELLEVVPPGFHPTRTLVRVMAELGYPVDMLRFSRHLGRLGYPAVIERRQAARFIEPRPNVTRESCAHCW